MDSLPLSASDRFLAAVDTIWNSHSHFWHSGHVFVKEPVGESSSLKIFESRLLMYAIVSRS
jgi:hypothetical protein